MTSTVVVLGSGSWGTALAIHLARIGHEVRLWGRSKETVLTVARERRHLADPGIDLPEGLTATSELGSACRQVDAAVFACPSHAMRSVAVAAAEVLPRGTLIVSTAKGIEQQGHRRMSVVLEETL